MRYEEVSTLHERDGYCFVIVFDFSKSKSIKIFFLSVFSLIITRAGHPGHCRKNLIFLPTNVAYRITAKYGVKTS